MKQELIKTKSRKITEVDVESIAKLVAKRITENGACLMLGIKEQQWKHWKLKHKNSATFEHLVTRIREAKLEACIDAIDESGDSREINLPNGKTYTKNGDWRAKAWLAERVLAPERFGDRQQDAAQVTVNLLTPEAMRRIEDSLTKRMNSPASSSVIDTSAPAKSIGPAGSVDVSLDAAQ